MTEYTWVTDDNGYRYQVKVSELIPEVRWDTGITDRVHIVINFIREDKENNVMDDSLSLDSFDTTKWEEYKRGIQRIVTIACSI